MGQTVILYFDHAENPNEVVGEIARAIDGLSDKIGYPRLHLIDDTGSDFYAVVIGDEAMTEEKARKAVKGEGRK